MTQKILTDPNELIFIQSRAETNLDLVKEYIAMMQDGVEFDAAQGVQDETGQIYVWDGFHRAAAAKQAGIPVLVEVQPGTRQDAEWLALSANQKHGLRRTKADEAWIARMALLKFSDCSIREIHRHTGINRRKITAIRDELVASGAIAPDNTVVVTRGGATFEQDTRNIGGTQPAYAPIWKLEAAIRQWLGGLFEEQAEQRQTLVEIKEQTVAGQQHLSQLLADDLLLSPKRKRDVIQACHNILDQLWSQTQLLHPKTVTLESNTGARAYEIRDLISNGRLKFQTTPASQPEHKPQPQEFECPRCRQEKIVGVNGSRRWCLNCGAEWPTAVEFLAEVKASRDQVSAGVTHTELQQRFLNILANLEEQPEQLIQVEIWLTELEHKVGLFTDLHPAAEPVAPAIALNLIPVLEYA